MSHNSVFFFRDIGTIVGIVIGSIVALILVVMVILLACSHLRYITGRDMLDYEDDAVISHDPSGATGENAELFGLSYIAVNRFIAISKGFKIIRIEIRT